MAFLLQQRLGYRNSLPPFSNNFHLFFDKTSGFYFQIVQEILNFLKKALQNPSI